MKVDSAYSPLGEFHMEFSREIYGIQSNFGQKLIVHGHPRQLTGDRLAVVSVLLLGEAVGSTLDVGRAVSSRVASQISNFVGVETVTVQNVVDSPPSNNHGGLEIVLDPNLTRLDRCEDELGRRRMLFVDLPSDKYAGRLFTFDSIQMTSNAYVFSSSVNSFSPISVLRSLLALVVLFSSDLSVSRVSISKELLAGSESNEFVKLQDLLNSIELNLAIEGE